jgi:hypothetical protein
MAFASMMAFSRMVTWTSRSRTAFSRLSNVAIVLRLNASNSPASWIANLWPDRLVSEDRARKPDNLGIGDQGNEGFHGVEGRGVDVDHAATPKVDFRRDTAVSCSATLASNAVTAANDRYLRCGPVPVIATPFLRYCT